MAVSIDGFCLVVRVTALDERFPGGVEAFLAWGNGVTACSDGKLARIAFMHRDDLARAASALDARGFGPSPERPADWACVAAATGVEPGCEWLEFGRYAGSLAAWIRGTNPEPLVIPPQWELGDRLINELDRSKLRFVSREGSVETWEHIETGKLHYMARHDDAATHDPAVLARLEQKFETATGLIMPLFDLANHPNPRPGLLDRRKLNKALRILDEVVAQDPSAGNAHWFAGIAKRILGDREGAYVSLRRAYLLVPQDVNYCREYVLQCMATERAKEAVGVAERISRENPDDFGLISNFGLTLLVAGDVERALEVVRGAHEREPDDPITLALLGMIEEVAAGKRARPTRYPP